MCWYLTEVKKMVERDLPRIDKFLTESMLNTHYCIYSKTCWNLFGYNLRLPWIHWVYEIGFPIYSMWINFNFSLFSNCWNMTISGFNRIQTGLLTSKHTTLIESSRHLSGFTLICYFSKKRFFLLLCPSSWTQDL